MIKSCISPSMKFAYIYRAGKWNSSHALSTLTHTNIILDKRKYLRYQLTANLIYTFLLLSKTFRSMIVNNHDYTLIIFVWVLYVGSVSRIKFLYRVKVILDFYSFLCIRIILPSNMCRFLFTFIYYLIQSYLWRAQIMSAEHIMVLSIFLDLKISMYQQKHFQ